MATTLYKRRYGMGKLRDTTSYWVSFSYATYNHFVSVFFLVVGQEELDAQSVNLRNRDDPSTKAKGAMMQLEDVVTKLLDLKVSRRLENKLV